MDKAEAIEKLNELRGQELYDFAAPYGVTVVAASGNINKGWGGQVLERHLGLRLNSSRAPNGGTWELKSPSLVYKNNKLAVKETMAITMITVADVIRLPFEQSDFFAKLNGAVVVPRIVTAQDRCSVHSVNEVNLTGDLYEAVKADYDLVRNILKDNPDGGLKSLTGYMGVYIQPRTKGVGHGSTSRAFYARPKFVVKVIQL